MRVGTQDGRTPAHAAAAGGHKDALRVLKELGADLDTPDQVCKCVCGSHCVSLKIAEQILCVIVSVPEIDVLCAIVYACWLSRMDALRLMLQLQAVTKMHFAY